MKHRTLGIVIVGTLSLFAVACGETNVDTDTPIGGGGSNAGGSAGASGSTQAGSSGTAGSAGTAGSSGTAGAAGGAAGSSGASGAGAAGASGAGAAGASGAGAAGASGAGAGGTAGAAGAAGAAGSTGSGIGDSCTDLAGAIVIDEAVVKIASSNAGASDDLSASCTGKGTRERVFRFRPQADGQITFTVTGDVSPSMYTLSGCPGSESMCSASAKLVAGAVVGADILVVVETINDKPYELVATPTPSSPKDMCSPAGFVNDLPIGQTILFEGNTSGGAASVAPSCSSDASGSERAYRVRPLKSGTMTVELASPDMGATLDGVVYVRDKCDASGAELACASTGGVGVTETTSFAATAGVTYFIIADTVGGASGPFELRVGLTP